MRKLTAYVRRTDLINANMLPIVLLQLLMLSEQLKNFIGGFHYLFVKNETDTKINNLIKQLSAIYKQ